MFKYSYLEFFLASVHVCLLVNVIIYCEKYQIVLFQLKVNNNIGSAVWTMSSSQGNKWNIGQITIPATSLSQDYQVTIATHTKENILKNLHISIFVTNRSCRGILICVHVFIL